MNPVLSNLKFRKTLFWVTTIFLTIHILLGSLSIFFNINFLPDKLNSFYKKLLVLGPFFTHTRIATSPHLYISYSSSGSWSPFQDVGSKNFADFQQHLWRYNRLKWSDYERYTGRKAFKEIKSLKHIDGSEGIATAELIQYISRLQLHTQSDSIKLVYILNTWQPESRSVKTDTAFAVIFKPTKGGASE